MVRYSMRAWVVGFRRCGNETTILLTNPQQMKATNSELRCYRIECTIGKGTFGKVKKATHIPTQEPVAIKILQKNKIKDITDVQRVTRQLHILKLVRHSSIAQLYEVIETADNIFMVMEYAQNGEFFDYIMDSRIRSQAEAHYYFAQIVSGLEYLHKLGIAHRDVKPENMLLDVQSKLKIVDFGLSNMYKPKEQLMTACGSPCYASPQMIRGQAYDPELTDVWSLGIVLFTMMMAKLPFQDDNTSVLYSKIKSGLYLIDRKVSPEYKDLLSKLISIKPQQRLKLKDIRKHPWFTNFSKINSFGINVGFDRIPIDDKIVKSIQKLGYPTCQTRRFLSYNIKNECTTVYYLSLKKQFKKGLINQSDICSDSFNQELIQLSSKKKPRHHSIDFNALVQNTEKQKVTDTTTYSKERKFLSQSKHLVIDMVHVNRQSCDSKNWEHLSHHSQQSQGVNKYHFGVSSVKSKEKREVQSQIQRKGSRKKNRPHHQQEYKGVINKLVRENRRLQTQHVREIYSKENRESAKRNKWVQVPQLFWKKRHTLAKGQTKYLDKGQTRYLDKRQPSSKKAIKTQMYN